MSARRRTALPPREQERLAAQRVYRNRTFRQLSQRFGVSVSTAYRAFWREWDCTPQDDRSFPRL